MTSRGCCLLFFFSPVFHPGGIMLRVHQARCSHDIYLMRSKALHKVPGTDMILWTNFIIVTPLTSGRFTNDEFGSSYSKWSLTSFILSFPFYPPLLLPPAITLWVCLYHRLQTAMSKFCPHSKLTEAMWLHWHQAWANNPSWEGFFFQWIAWAGLAYVYPCYIVSTCPKSNLSWESPCIWNVLLPSLFSWTDLFPWSIKRPCTRIYVPHSQQNCMAQRTAISITATCWCKAAQKCSALAAIFSSLPVATSFSSKQLTKMIPSFNSYHDSLFLPTVPLVSFVFCITSHYGLLNAMHGTIPVYGSLPFCVAIPMIFPRFLLHEFIFGFQRPDRALPWGLTTSPYSWLAPGWRQTCKYHSDCNGK